MSNAPNLVALLTPSGKGALATVALQGPRALDILQACVTRPIPRDSSPRPWFRSFRSGPEVTEELIVVPLGDNHVRVHCHGGNAATQAIIEAIVAQGAAHVGAAEWREPTAVESAGEAARQLLPHALTERTALILLDQMRGALDRKLVEIREEIRAGRTAEATQQLREVLSRAPLGRRLTTPWRVVIAGRPNAGKSTLLNALLGIQRAITSPLPGTTRDVVTSVTAFAGWPVELCDTAGLRPSDDPLESLGIARARQEISQADLVLLLNPADEPVAAPDQSVTTSQQCSPVPLLRIRSKADQPAANESGDLAVSALTGMGLEQLAERIADSLVPSPPPAGTAVPVTPNQVAALTSCIKALEQSNPGEALQALNFCD